MEKRITAQSGIYGLGFFAFWLVAWVLLDSMMQVLYVGPLQALVLYAIVAGIFSIFNLVHFGEANYRYAIEFLGEIQDEDLPSGWQWSKFFPVALFTKFLAVDTTDQIRNEQDLKKGQLECEAQGGVTIRWWRAITWRVKNASAYYARTKSLDPKSQKVQDEIYRILDGAFTEYTSAHEACEHVSVSGQAKAATPKQIVRAVVLLIKENGEANVTTNVNRVSIEDWGVEFNFSIVDREEASDEMRRATEKEKVSQKVAAALLGQVKTFYPDFESMTAPQKRAAIQDVRGIITADSGQLNAILDKLIG